MDLFNHEERSFLDLFRYEESSLWIFFFMLYVWNISKPFVINIICVHTYWIIHLLCLVRSYLRRWLSQGIYLCIYWLYLADATAVYIKMVNLYFKQFVCLKNVWRHYPVTYKITLCSIAFLLQLQHRLFKFNHKTFNIYIKSIEIYAINLNIYFYYFDH